MPAAWPPAGSGAGGGGNGVAGAGSRRGWELLRRLVWQFAKKLHPQSWSFLPGLSAHSVRAALSLWVLMKTIRTDGAPSSSWGQEADRKAGRKRWAMSCPLEELVLGPLEGRTHVHSWALAREDLRRPHSRTYTSGWAGGGRFVERVLK